jgi:hypothetical protein
MSVIAEEFMHLRQVVAAALLSAASLGSLPSSAGTATSGAEERLKALAEARSKWARAKPKFGYDLTISVNCMCATSGDYVLHVRGDQVVRLERTDENNPPPDFTRNVLKDYTVDGLFRKIEAAITSGAETVNVLYEFNYGYPSAIQIDRRADTSDDEQQLTARMSIPRDAE